MRKDHTMLVRRYLSLSKQLGFRKHWAGGILGLQLGAVLFEGVGVGMFLPVLQYINKDSDIGVLSAESSLWRHLIELFGLVGLQVNLATLLCVAFAAFVARQLFMYARQIYSARIQYDLARNIRNGVFASYLEAGLEYHDSVRSGDIVNELTVELANAISCLVAFVNFVGYLIFCVVYVGFALAISPLMTMAAILTFLVAARSLSRILNRTQSVGIAVTSANQEMSSFLVQRLKSVRLVRLSGMEWAENTAMRALNQEQRDQVVNMLRLKAFLSVAIEPLVIAIGFVLLYVAVNFFNLALELIFLFSLIFLRLLPVIKEVITTRQSFVGSMASVEVVNSRISELGVAREPSNGREFFANLEQGILVDNAVYSYPSEIGERSALNGVTLQIPSGQMTALVGPSGAGKSTLVDILPRLRDLQSGQVLFDGVPHTEFDLASLRRGVAFAPQSPQMFNVSILEHIRYGRTDATMEEVELAAHLAQAHEFVAELPEGYESLLGEGGSRLSGGQRQRIDLARVLVRRAPILILDEPTSNLDAESERLLRQALYTIRDETNTTIIVIGHRLSTIADADQIAILSQGRIACVGTHAKLSKIDGWYASALEAQQS
jgi:ABC-type multidrug transport system fused ATPase/permease subunit